MSQRLLLLCFSLLGMAYGQGWFPIFVRDCTFRYDSEIGYQLYTPWKGTKKNLEQVWKHNQDGFKVLVWGIEHPDLLPDSRPHHPDDTISIRFLLTNYSLDFGGFENKCDTISIYTHWSHEHILRNRVWAQLPKPDTYRSEKYKMEHSILYGLRMWAGEGCPFGVLPSLRFSSNWKRIEFVDSNEIKINKAELCVSRDTLESILLNYKFLPDDSEDVPSQKLLLKAFHKYWLFPHPIAYQIRVQLTERDGTSRSIVLMFYIGETLSEYMLYGTKGVPEFRD